jgi:hypothetical protein
VSKTKNTKNVWWKVPSVISDISTITVSISVIIISILDLLNFLDLSWFQSNIGKVTLILVSVIAFSQVVERRNLANNIFRDLSKEIQSIQPTKHFKRMESAGLSNFYVNRDDYTKYRGAPKLLDYLSLAKKSVRVAAYWMSHGIEMEGIANDLAEMVKQPKNLDLAIAIIDPTAPYIHNLASYLSMSPDELTFRAQNSLIRLWQARQNLPEDLKPKFKIKVYSTVPIASVIILDAEETNGRVQIDLKAYKVPRHQSFAFELSGSGNSLYDLCRDAWSRLIKESEDFDPKRHLVDISFNLPSKTSEHNDN